ncbi:uncharacterized protein LOC100891999 [Strongylocentrotus purpuratus]|uniref:Uncharacterized protein n=1 Tax=Strongylocentrotus purpuratus TaxID=7668 RepID=A0A7M7GJ08_STRPU|nr:uncharacterized protein LOC100891999 [Strongylocentrotus purpuratus]
MAPSVTAAPAHYVSVMMCSGPSSGRVFAVLEQDLVHRSKKLNIGSHVLVKRHDGSKRFKGVVVHMNPFINARVPPPAQASAVPVITPPRQRLAKRPREPEHPSLADNVAVHAAKRFKAVQSMPVTLPGVSSFQPAMLQRGPRGAVLIPRFDHQLEHPVRRLFATDPCPSSRYPNRQRVRRELIYTKTSMKLKSSSAPVSVEELDGIVPLDCLDNVVTLDQLSAFVTQAVEAAVVPVSPLHPTPVRPVAPTSSEFRPEFRPLRPAPYSRSLMVAEPRRVNGYRTERRTARRQDVRPLRCVLPDLLMTSPRLG